MPAIHTVIINPCIKCSTNTFHHRFVELGVTNRRTLFAAQCDIPIKEIAYGDYIDLFRELTYIFVNNQQTNTFRLIYLSPSPRGGINGDPSTIYMGSGDINNPPNPNIPIILGTTTQTTDSSGNVAYFFTLDQNQIIPFISGYKYQIAVGDTCLSTPFELLS